MSLLVPMPLHFFPILSAVLPQANRLSTTVCEKWHDEALVSSWHNSRIFKHQNNGPLWRSRSVHDSLRYHESLPWSKFNPAVLQIDEQLALDYVEEFVVVVML